jgi:hypothetical protein
MHKSRVLIWFLAPAALLLLVGLAYREAPKNVFHLDDESNIVRHPPVLMTTLTLGNLLDAGRKAFLPDRPLPSMTFAIDWWRGGGSARAFQWTNLFLHGAASVSVYWLLLLVLGRLGGPGWSVGVAAFLGAALWACHPIQVQGVTYVVQRMTSMAALFTVLSVALYILGRGAAGPSRRWLCFVLAGLCWALGLISKETAAIAPFLVLLAEYGVLRHGRALVRGRLDLVVLSLPVLAALLIVLDVASEAGPLARTFLPGYGFRDFTLAERLLTQPRVIGFHLSQILWPLPGRFSLEHDFAVSTGLLTPVSTLPALLAVISWGLLGVGALFRTRWRVVGFFLLWVPATLVIESTIIPLEMVFEHRMYLPSVALAGLAAAGLSWGLRQAVWLRLGALAVCGAVVLLLVLSTSQRVPVWRSDLSLAQDVVESAPNSARSWSTLANALKERGHGWDVVMPPVEKALARDPEQPVALHLLAVRLVELGRLEEAEKILDRLVREESRDHSVRNTIGMLHLRQGDLPRAIADFERAIELNPFVPEFRYNLALSYELSGRCREARLKWLAYLEHETDDRRRAVVRARLRRNFDTAGGRCFGSGD